MKKRRYETNDYIIREYIVKGRLYRFMYPKSTKTYRGKSQLEKFLIRRCYYVDVIVDSKGNVSGIISRKVILRKIILEDLGIEINAVEGYNFFDGFIEFNRPILWAVGEEIKECPYWTIQEVYKDYVVEKGRLVNP